MRQRAYISNINRFWPLERQREVLAGIEPVYEDVLRPGLLRERSVEKLEDRQNLLHPTARKTTEEIHVASLVCLAWHPTDLKRVIVEAAARKATIVVRDLGVELPPGTDDEAAERAVKAFEACRKLASKKPWLKRGYEVALERREADIQRRIDLIRDDWEKDAVRTPALLARAGRGEGEPMNYRTAVKRLGTRKEAKQVADARASYLIRKQAKKDAKK